jgi:hypothetical protein
MKRAAGLFGAETRADQIFGAATAGGLIWLFLRPVVDISKFADHDID